MPDIVTVREGKYIHVKSVGEFALDETRNTFDRIIAFFEETGINKVLVDTREQTRTPSALDSITGAEELTSQARKILFAIVVKDKIEANRSLFENAAVNRGAILKLFLDEKSALDWLFK